MAKPSPNTVDVFLSTLDQASPTTAKPVGRLTRLVNAIVSKFQNPRAADGTVTHVRVEKRPGFVSYSDAVHNADGASLGTLPADTPQALFGGGDALRLVAGNRLYTKTQGWVKAATTAGGDTVVLPQTLRSTVVYTADSQAEAPDMAVLGDVQCLVWREVSLQSTSDATSPSTTATALDGVRVMLRNGDGVIRSPFRLDPIGGTPAYRKARVFAAGGHFWVLQDSPSTGTTFRIDVTVLDTTGAVVASTNITTPSGGEHWDASAISEDDADVTIAQPNNGNGVKFTFLTWSAGIVISTATDLTIRCDGLQCAWLTDEDPAAGYLATVDGATAASEVWAYKIVNGASTHEYPQVAGPIDQTATWISGITGYAASGATPALVVAFTLMELTTSGLPFGTSAERTIYFTNPDDQLNTSASNNYPDQLANQLKTYAVPYTGTSSILALRWSMSLASRAFRLGADYVAIGYYPARKFGPLTPAGAAAPHFPQRPLDPSNFQPTWYVIPLGAVQVVTQGAAIAGRFEYGLATADYQVCAHNGSAIVAGPRNRCLGSAATLANGAVALPLGYRAEQSIPGPALFYEVTRTPLSAPPGAPPGIYTLQTYQTDNTVGVKLFTFGPDCGQPFVANQTTYLPGLMASVVEPGDVEPVEQGLAAPECPIVTRSATAATPAVEGTYLFRIVAEYTSRGGKTCRSLPSAAFSYKALTADADALDVRGHNVHQTLKKNVKLSIYRTGFVTATVDGSSTLTTPPTVATTEPLANVATSGYYKITNDLRPLYNDPTTFPVTFTDHMGIGTQGTGELLYTDEGKIPRFPAPAHRGGCVWQNRAWLIGYDNALWFSGEIAEGESEWFNPGFRVFVPTNEEITAVAAMDSFLLVFCARSIWYLPAGAALPDATGSGTIPSAIRLPFEQGSTGFVAVTRQGAIYSASTGGAWMITRSLENVWVGQDAEDELAGTITGMTLAGMLVVVAMDTSPQRFMVFDTNLGGWARWDVFSDGALVTAQAGQTAWADPARVFVQTPGVWRDNDTNAEVELYVPMSATVAPVHIAGVRSWKRTWALQLEGQTYDTCTLAVGLSYTDADVIDYDAPARDLEAGLLEEEVRPSKQLTSSMGVTVADSENDDTDTGRGFALEVVSFYIGLEKGLNKLPPSKRA